VTAIHRRFTSVACQQVEERHYNNFYEFTTNKDRVAEASMGFTTHGWKLEVGGLCAKPKVFELAEVLALAPPEERIYRMRCVEAWSMVVPWAGYSLATLLSAVEPLPTAKYVAFETLKDPTRMPGESARLVPTVVKLAMTAGDPYETLVIAPTCDEAVKSCIALQDGADDLGACGSYRDVSACVTAGPLCGDDSADLEACQLAGGEICEVSDSPEPGGCAPGLVCANEDPADPRLKTCQLVGGEICEVSDSPKPGGCAPGLRCTDKDPGDPRVKTCEP